MSAVNVSVIPKGRNAFVVVAVKMGKEMLESIFGERFAEVKIIDNYIGIGNNAGH